MLHNAALEQYAPPPERVPPQLWQLHKATGIEGRLHGDGNLQQQHPHLRIQRYLQ